MMINYISFSRIVQFFLTKEHICFEIISFLDIFLIFFFANLIETLVLTEFLEKLLKVFASIHFHIMEINVLRERDNPWNV